MHQNRWEKGGDRNNSSCNFCATFHWIVLLIIAAVLLLLFRLFTSDFSSFGLFLLQNDLTSTEGEQDGFWDSSEFDISGEEEEEAGLFPGEAGASAKYILANFPKGECGGLGNQMFRFAALYGIGRPIGRRPAFARYDHCEAPENHGNGPEHFREAELPFPLYRKHLKFVDTPGNETGTAPNFGLDCCKFDDPGKLLEFGQSGAKSAVRYLQTLANYLQSYKYFHNYRRQIRQIFQCSAELRQKAREIHRKLPGGHKFCVHTRRGDFRGLWFESKKDFTEKATRHIHNWLEERHKTEVSVLLFGDDKPFLDSLELGSIRHYLVEGLSRNEDFCLAVHSCQSLLLSASASTFGWWIGYLMREQAHIFYNSDLNFTHYSLENFPPEWTPVGVGREGQVEELEGKGRARAERVFPRLALKISRFNK